MTTKEWRDNYAKGHRKEMNAYAREYYKNHKEKHLVRVKAWKKANPDKVQRYNNSDRAREQRRLSFAKYSRLNREKLRAYNREWHANRMIKERGAKVIIKNAVKRKFGHFYWIDKEGNLCATKIHRNEW